MHRSISHNLNVMVLRLVILIRVHLQASANHENSSQLIHDWIQVSQEILSFGFSLSLWLSNLQYSTLAESHMLFCRARRKYELLVCTQDACFLLHFKQYSSITYVFDTILACMLLERRCLKPDLHVPSNHVRQKHNCENRRRARHAVIGSAFTMPAMTKVYLEGASLSMGVLTKIVTCRVESVIDGIRRPAKIMHWNILTSPASEDWRHRHDVGRLLLKKIIRCIDHIVRTHNLQEFYRAVVTLTSACSFGAVHTYIYNNTIFVRSWPASLLVRSWSIEIAVVDCRYGRSIHTIATRLPKLWGSDVHCYGGISLPINTLVTPLQVLNAATTIAVSRSISKIMTQICIVSSKYEDVVVDSLGETALVFKCSSGAMLLITCLPFCGTMHLSDYLRSTYDDISKILTLFACHDYRVATDNRSYAYLEDDVLLAISFVFESCRAANTSNCICDSNWLKSARFARRHEINHGSIFNNPAYEPRSRLFQL
mmetsp:Transcript_5062/g.14986  ORF Transcript_5062/g.14986 Transcript_5062/m.14986 type:complete len:484 (-) Transcript_5062:583-2034(-)